MKYGQADLLNLGKGLCVGLCVLISPFAISMLLNNAYLTHTYYLLDHVQHPKDSYGLNRVSIVANLAPTSNACYFGAAEIRSSTLSRSQIQQFYIDYEKTADDYSATLRYFIYFPTDDIPVEEHELTDLMPYFSTLSSSTEIIYMLEVKEGPFLPAQFDYRCH